MKYNVYLFLAQFFFLFGCAADHIPPVTKGNIEGNVAVFDEYGSAVGDPSNVKVRLEGSDPAIEVFTDKDGNWSFHDVPAGTYDIILSKEGFATYKILRTPHVGGYLATVPYMDVIPMYKKTSQIVTGAKLFGFDGSIGASASGTNRNQHVVAFIGYEGSNSPQNYVSYYNRNLVFSGLAQQPSAYKALGFKSGDKISIKFYGSIPVLYRYFDPTVNEMIFANLSDDYKELIFTLP